MRDTDDHPETDWRRPRPPEDVARWVDERRATLGGSPRRCETSEEEPG